MPTLIWSKVKDGLDPSMKKKAYAFFEKLQESDELPGLHIEPLVGSVDPRVRTGRVDDNFRCVLFKIAVEPQPVYVIHGVWPHDKANSIGERITLSMNPVNGVPEVKRVMDELLTAASTPAAPVTPTHRDEAPRPAPAHGSTEPASTPAWPRDVTAAALVTDLGIDPSLAGAALAAPSEADLMEVIASAAVEWQGSALLDLATGRPLSDVRDAYSAPQALAPDLSDDEKLVKGLQSSAAQSAFHLIEDNEELRRIIEAGDLGAWRLFLHPDQRAFVDHDFNGPARLSGGAGTGKTVVAVHRAHRLARTNPSARVLLTTFTRNLADDLSASLTRLDDTLPQVHHLDEAGLHVKGIDALAWAIVQRAGEDIAPVAENLLGSGRTAVLKSTPPGLWAEAIDAAGTDLPEELRSPAFFEAEYGLVILPAAITTGAQYGRVRRQGRGVSLDRAKRAAVWKVVEAYRAKSRAAESTDFHEKAALAARWLTDTNTHLFDHVLVDEAQDLSPSHLTLLRAVVAERRNDLFLCEDSHQRIYGQKITLSHYGINIRGRSRRLTLNYRTTAQNLQWAMTILDGGDYSDLDGEAEAHRYHSARTGPRPVVRECTSASDEIRQAAELVRSWLPADGEPGRAPAPEAIAVLVRDRWKRETVVNGLAEQGIAARSVDREPVRAGKPVVMTMHRAKGLEFTHVLLLGTEAAMTAPRGFDTSAADLADAELRQRSLVYVAATRARDVLAVIP